MPPRAVVRAARPPRHRARARRSRCATRSTASPRSPRFGCRTAPNRSARSRRVSVRRRDARSDSVLADLLAGTNVVAGRRRRRSGRARAAQPRRAAVAADARDGAVDRACSIASSSRAARWARRSAKSPSDSTCSTAASWRARTRTRSRARSTDYVPGVWSWTQSPTSIVELVRQHSRRELVRAELSKDLYRRHRGREPAARQPLRARRDRPHRSDSRSAGLGAVRHGRDQRRRQHRHASRRARRRRPARDAVRTTAGLMQSDFSHGVLAQNHALVARRPARARSSADLHVVRRHASATSFPNGYSRDLHRDRAARASSASASTFSATARFFMQEAGSATSPLLTPPTPPRRHDDAIARRTDAPPQSVHEYTLGTTATFAPNDRWTHSVVAGVDGYRLANVQTSSRRSSARRRLGAARARRAAPTARTLRGSSVLQLGDERRRRSATLTLSAEHGAVSRDVARVRSRRRRRHDHGVPGPLSERMVSTWQNNTGLTTQANGVAGQHAVRHRRRSRRARQPARRATRSRRCRCSALAAVRDYGPIHREAARRVRRRHSSAGDVRARASSGRTPTDRRRSQRSAPRSKPGTEAGLDVAVPARAVASRHALRPARVGTDPAGRCCPPTTNPQSRRMRYELENVGEITNRGWEMEASASLSRLTVSGTLSFVDSRVEKLATGYNGDLSRRRPHASGSGAHREPQRVVARRRLVRVARRLARVRLDQLRRARSGARVHERHACGARARWASSCGSTGGATTAACAFARRRRATSATCSRFEVSGDNLLNYQQNEPDNMTVLPGRTIMTGVRVKF